MTQIDTFSKSKIRNIHTLDKLPFTLYSSIQNNNQMPKHKSLFLILTILLFSATIEQAHAHSMFNSAEKFYAGYRVQVATAPEFPQINEPSLFLVKVTDENFNEVDEFTMGIRVFFHDDQVDAIPPTLIQGGHWDFDHTWRNQGNHIVLIDLYNMSPDKEILTYTFNMGTQSPFGFIFFSAIVVGALTFTGIMLYIYMPKILKRA